MKNPQLNVGNTNNTITTPIQYKEENKLTNL